jgi:hypothetical protein
LGSLGQVVGEILNATAIPLGINLSADIGQVTQASSSGWGRATWGYPIWMVMVQFYIWISATFDVGNVTIDAEVNSGWSGGSLGAKQVGVHMVMFYYQEFLYHQI